MSQAIEYTPVKLLPSMQTGTNSPFVAPPFEMAFRRCEKLLWEGNSLSDQVCDLIPERKGDVGLDFFERRLSLRLTYEEMVKAKPLLERELEGMGRHLDPRYTRCSDADCMEGWLLDGAKINLVKARTLLQHLESVMGNINNLLEETVEAACEARELLTREAEKASSAQMSRR